MITNSVLKIVRGSIEKHAEEEKKRKQEEEKNAEKVRKRKERMAEKEAKEALANPNPKPKPKPKSPPPQPALIPAVEYVKAERRQANLPESAVEENAMIEEKLVRAELREKKGADINSELDTYLDTQTFSKKIVYANWADRVASEMREWVLRPRKADEPQPMKITEFFREKGIYHRDFYRLMKRYPILEYSLNFALQALGDIRERNVLENKWNAPAGMFMMGHYDEDWRKETERREAAKVKQVIAAGVNIEAVMDAMTIPVAPTEEVRLKKEQDMKREK